MSSSPKYLESWRERSPSSYSLKVKNFSQFVSSTVYSDGKYQSRSFSSGDYKWRLIIYPKGNEKDSGSGFISMYVEIDSKSLIATTQSEVYADLRFFVFNKKENKYFTIQDIEPKPFNTLRTRWGLSQVLPLETFNNHINGYLFDGDHCEFGVEINVTPPPTKWEIVSFDVKPMLPKFSWTVTNFSKIKANPHLSDSFLKGGKKWFLKLYPKGYPSSDSKWLSISLCLADGETLKENEKIYVQATLKLEDPHGCRHLTGQFDCWFAIPGGGYRLVQFVSMAELRKSYLDEEDTLKVEIEFKTISSTAYDNNIRQDMRRKKEDVIREEAPNTKAKAAHEKKERKSQLWSKFYKPK